MADAGSGGATGAGDGDAQSIFVTASDGMKLHVRCSRPPARSRGCRWFACRASPARRTISKTWPVRSPSAPETPRRVIALDYRGRGLSDYDRNPQNYSLSIELGDVLTVLTALVCRPRCSSAPRAAAF